MQEKLRFGVLSTASIARSAFIPGVQNARRAEIAAVASRDYAKAKDTAEQFDIPKAYGTYEELLKDPDIDAVYIPLPNHLHKEWTIKAAKAGKHVLCEKPSALSPEEASEMVEACREAGVIFSEAFMYRYHPKHRRVREIIEEGEIGQIRAIHGCFTYNHIENKENVRYKKTMGGGAIYDVGGYPISAARMILGEEPLAVSVQALFSEEHDHVDVMATGLVEFPNGVGLTFDCGMWAAPRCTLEIVGSLGRIELPVAFGWEQSEEPAQIIVHVGDQRREERFGVLSHFMLEADAFAAAVLDGTPLPYPPEDAVRNMKVVEACLKSAETKQKVFLQ